jgi:DNA-binding transcriptional MerR regulator
MPSTVIEKPEKLEGLGFYTPAEASRIAQVPQWTVNFWRRSGIVIPSVKWVDERGNEHIGYTFETVVFLRLIRLLRDRGIPLVESATSVKILRDRFGAPSKEWAEAKIFVDIGDVMAYSDKDKWDTTDMTRAHQKVAEFMLGKEFRRLKERADALLIPEQFLRYVEIDPSIQNGLPIILGTSMRTSLIHKLRQLRYKYADIHDMYPFVLIDKIMGAERYETFLDRALVSP